MDSPAVALDLPHPLPEPDEDGCYREPIPEVDRLEPEEEAELVREARAGNRVALDALLYAHEPVVLSACKAWRDSGWHEELQQDARAALLKAWEEYDPDRGRFGVFARSVVRNTVAEQAAEYTSPVSVNWEARWFRRKYKRAARDFIREHNREPWYGELAPYLADTAREELVRVWGQLWPNRDAPDPLWPEGLELEDAVRGAGAERIDRIITCISFLRAKLNAVDHPRDIEEKVGQDAGGDGIYLHELIADPSTSPEEAEKARERREQQAERCEAVRKLVEVPGLLTDRMRYALRASLDLDGQGEGSRTPEEIAGEMTTLLGEDVRPYSVRRTLERATRRLREYVAGGGRYVDPFRTVEEGAEPPALDELEIIPPDAFDAFEFVEALQQARTRRPYPDAFEVAEREEAQAWQEAIQQVLQL